MAKMVVLSAMMILILKSTISAKEQLSTKECEDLGFTGLALCSDCHSLSEYVKDQGSFLSMRALFDLNLDYCSFVFFSKRF